MSCMRPQRSVVSHFWHCYDSTVVTQKSCFDLFQVISEVLRGLARSWRAELFGFINLDEEDQNSRYLQDSGLKRYVMPPDGDSLHTWAAGARYDLSKFSPYYIGFFTCIRYAILHRFKILEGGRANATFKISIIYCRYPCTPSWVRLGNFW
jgi:hypothetical protein